MAIVKFDQNGINNKVKPQINGSINNLNSAIGIISSINIPSNFAHSSTLRNINNNIRNSEQKISQINKWVSSLAARFQEAEAKSNNIVNSMVSKITTNTDINKTGAKVQTQKNIKNVSNNKDKLETNITSRLEKIFTLGKKIYNGIKDVGAKVVEGCENFYKDIIEPIFESDAAQKTKAVIADAKVTTQSLVKGVLQFGESLFDAAAIAATGLQSIYTGMGDGINYLSKVITGNEEDFQSRTTKNWENTMSFVAEEHVENLFSSYYKSNIVGKWLSENADEAFKPDGVVSNIASGIGYVGGVITLTIGTLGAGTALTGAGAAAGATTTAIGTATATTTTTGAVISGIAATGKYTQEHWASARDASWEGIERMYDKGEITLEQLKSFEMIKSLSEEQWKEIVSDFESGKITEDEYSTMKQIYEMPEDWTTLENGIKGLGYGIANGVWEGVQWYVGGKIGNWTMKGTSKVVTSTVRVGVDTTFNALDTPYRVAIDAITSDRNLKESWLNQGGCSSVITNVGIGLIGSVGGEIFDSGNLDIKTKVEDNNINEAVQNIIDSEHGFQLNMNDLGDFYKHGLETGFFDKKQIENILEGINSYGYIDENTGKFLKELMQDDSRIFIKTVHSRDVDSIMDEGIRCLGTSTSTGTNVSKAINDINLNNTVTDISKEGLMGLISKLKNSNGFSQGLNPIDGAIIIKIPKDAKIDDILKYNSELGLYNIDPKYNLGFIGCSPDGVLDASKILMNSTKKLNDTFLEMFSTANQVDKKYAFTEVSDVELINTSPFKESGEQLLKKYKKRIGKGQLSDETAVKLVYDSFEKSINNGNPYAENVLKKLIELKKKNPDITFEITPQYGGSYWSWGNKSLVLGQNIVDWEANGVFYHEMGHMLFSLTASEKMPTNWGSIVEKAKVISSNGIDLLKIQDEFIEKMNRSYTQANNEFEMELRKRGFASVDDYINAWTSSIELYTNKYGKMNTIEFWEQQGFNEDVAKLMQDPYLIPKDIATVYVQNEIGKIYDKIMFTQLGDDGAISDIIDAVYLGYKTDIYGNPINNLICAHRKGVLSKYSG